MNKGELIEVVAKDTGISKELAGQVLDSIIQNLFCCQEEGKKRTGKAIKIPTKKVFKFKAAAKLAKAVK